MKVLFRDLRQGLVKVRVDGLDDLWYLSQVILEGDLIRGETTRRIKDKEDTKSSGGERRTFTLGLRVEKLDFNSDTDSLRVSGTIEDGPEDAVALGSHHTLNVDAGSVIGIKKSEWSRALLDLLKNAEKSSWRPKVLVVAVDEGEATIGLLRDSIIQYSEISRNIGGKYDLKGRAERKKDFYSELASMVGNIAGKENVSRIILAGAGFEKDSFFDYLKDSDKNLAGKCVIENTGSSGRNAINETIKRPTLKTTVEEANSAVDVKLVDELLTNISKDSGLAVYGLPDVEAAVNTGAAGTLLLTDAIFLRERKKLEGLMKNVEKNRGIVHIINKEGEAGKQLESIGGVAALLRYKLKY
ncbi:MAG: mRNA surveillance protein pelota [Candidatus Altiarchaeota archaeon]|nr:mRNA surveillance protein pelota [Candidatus Altiarchaeota archaeon]